MAMVENRKICPIQRGVSPKRSATASRQTRPTKPRRREVIA
jgi:hypothetical protein